MGHNAHPADPAGFFSPAFQRIAVNDYALLTDGC